MVRLEVKSSDGETMPIEQDVLANRAAAFKLDGLKPDTKYSIESTYSMVPKKAGFRTFPENFSLASGFNFAALSCNDIETGAKIDSEHDLWHHLAQQAD